MTVRPAKTQISLGFRPVWSESLLSAWWKLESLATHWAHSEDSDQTGRIVLVLSCRGSTSRKTLTLGVPVSTAFLAHLSRRLTRWAYRMGLEPASVHPCIRASVRASTLSNMNISETSRPITTKFYLKHHWGGGKAALGFDADQIRTLVSMATDSSHRVIMGKRASSRFLDCFWSDPFYTCR